jgi:hypothetical protein
MKKITGFNTENTKNGKRVLSLHEDNNSLIGLVSLNKKGGSIVPVEWHKETGDVLNNSDSGLSLIKLETEVVDERYFNMYENRIGFLYPSQQSAQENADDDNIGLYKITMFADGLGTITKV